MISAVLISWNRCDLLQAAIRSLQRQNYPRLEIIVVDNGSTDGSLVWLREQPHIHLIENHRNFGASAARNQGTRSAQGKYVLYMDSDAELCTEQGLQKLITLMESDSHIAGTAGIYFSDQALTELWCWSPCMDWEGYFDPQSSMRAKENPPVLSTCFSIYRRSALLDIGGFDEYFFYLYEDGDLSDRLWKRGYRLCVDPEVKIWHHYATPGRTVRDQRDYHRYTERMRMNFLIKNWGIKRFTKSWLNKILKFKTIRDQFPYLSLWDCIDIYLFRSIYYLLRNILVVRYRKRNWI